MNNLLRKKTNELSKKKKKGFTLVELIVVIAIIAILAAMAIPRLGAMRANARVSNDVAAAKNIATIAATLVANGELSADIADVSGDAGASIRANLQGSAAPQGLTGSHFKVDLPANASGNITVYVVNGSNEYQLYPEDQEDKTSYATAARS